MKPLTRNGYPVSPLAGMDDLLRAILEMALPIVAKLRSFCRPTNQRVSSLGSAIIISFLAGCATPLPVPREIKIPISSPCVSAADLPVRPITPTDAEYLVMDEAIFVVELWREKRLITQFANEQSALLQACITAH